MNSKINEPNPSDLILTASSLIAQSQDHDRTLQHVAEVAADHLGASVVGITLRTRAGNWTARAATAPADTSQPPFLVFSRRIVVRSRDYGHFGAEISTPSKTPARTMLVLEATMQLLGMLAERAVLEERREELRREVEEGQKALQRAKLFARARGIVASLRRIPEGEAARWIEAEAARSGRPLEVIVDRIILTRTSQINRAPGLPSHLLSKTA